MNTVKKPDKPDAFQLLDYITNWIDNLTEEYKDIELTLADVIDINAKMEALLLEYRILLLKLPMPRVLEMMRKLDVTMGKLANIAYQIDEKKK
jgi:hypothetical protein